MRQALVAACLLVVLLAPAADAQEEAFYTVEEVEYYYAAGTLDSGHATLGVDPTGANQQQFNACAWARIRPDIDRGRVQAFGELQGLPITVDISNFPKGQGLDYIRRDAPVETADGRQQMATILAEAEANIWIDDQVWVDPVTGQTNFSATWFVTEEAFRDNATGAILDEAAADEYARINGPELEMHLVVNPSAEGEPQPSVVWQTQEPSDGTPYLLPEEDHHRVYSIRNERLTGTGVLQVDAQTMSAQSGEGLTFTLFAPNGAVIETLEVTPELQNPDSITYEFDLDRLGAYFLEVEGAVDMTRYSVSIEQQTPDNFTLDMWWDVVRPGYDGLTEKIECENQLAGEATLQSVPPRPQPTQFDWIASLFTVGAGLTTVLVATTLIISAYGRAAAKRAVSE